MTTNERMNEPKPYSAYKEPSIPWIGNVPADWEIRKLRHILASTTERNHPDLPLLSVVREKGVIIRDLENSDDNHNVVPEDLTNYKVVRVGQFAMNKMKAWQGSYGVSNYEGIVSPAYFIFDIAGVNPDFFNKAIRSKAYVSFFAQASDGVRIAQWDLSPDQMKEIQFLMPPPAEQAAIVRFLDHADEQIQRYIAAKQRLIALLEEQRQAAIHQAVTRGLDPEVKLKDSGVDWLGDIPDHWNVKRAKFLFKEIDDRSMEGKETHLSMSQSLGLVPSEQVEQSLISDSYAGAKLCQKGDVVLNRLKAHLGVFAVARQPGVVSADYSIFRQRNGEQVEYFEKIFKGPAIRKELRIRSKGIVEGFWRLYTDDFFSIPLPAPPVQ